MISSLILVFEAEGKHTTKDEKKAAPSPVIPSKKKTNKATSQGEKAAGGGSTSQKEISVEMEGGANNNTKDFDPDAAPTVFGKIDAPIKPMEEKHGKRRTRRIKTVRSELAVNSVILIHL